MKWIHSCESVFGKTGSKGGGVVVNDATAANGLFGTAGTKMKVLSLTHCSQCLTKTME